MKHISSASSARCGSRSLINFPLCPRGLKSHSGLTRLPCCALKRDEPVAAGHRRVVALAPARACSRTCPHGSARPSKRSSARVSPSAGNAARAARTAGRIDHRADRRSIWRGVLGQQRGERDAAEAGAAPSQKIATAKQMPAGVGEQGINKTWINSLALKSARQKTGSPCSRDERH